MLFPQMLPTYRITVNLLLVGPPIVLFLSLGVDLLSQVCLFVCLFFFFINIKRKVYIYFYFSVFVNFIQAS